MIYKNGKPWDGWKENLKQYIPANQIDELVKKAKFVPTEKYSGYRRIGENNRPPEWRKTNAVSIGLPIEFAWTDEHGERCMIRYVERSDMRQVGDKMVEVLEPGSFYIDTRTEQSFNCKNRRELLWFFLMNPYCDNGFLYDHELWGIGKEKAEENRLVRVDIPGYRFIDEERRKEQQLVEKRRIRTAKNKADELSEENKKELYAALGGADVANRSLQDVELWLEDYCENPEQAGKLLDYLNDNISYQSIANQAQEKELISYHKQERAWRFKDSRETICLVPKGENPSSSFVQWLRSKDDSGEVLNLLQERLKGNSKNGEKRGKNEWQKFVQEYRDNHPGMSYKDAMKEAAKEWKKKEPEPA